ncbi:Disulfide-bond oxidoreductase YfcG [Paraburkholderia nemoris]|uniref:glutathione S-transferase family protein n=1 Tax=Paraburkholderia nemoris TaxID=2793076 RepID=UPI001B270FDD|nr:glutathione S-transferase family protein [Paraburkholderia nemoris]CAE6906178.1 Disulfide-bond oxidoreductase YfcG [Paraburkholderia nemoris]
MTVSFELVGASTGNCLRAAIALEEAGIEYKFRRVDLQAGEQRSNEHLPLNPAGKVPVLIERNDVGSLVISQSNAIMLHIADRGSMSLLPKPGDPLLAVALERFFYFVTDVIAPSHAGHFLESKQQPAAAGLLRQRSLDAIEFAERFLAEAPFLAGENFTLADICAVTIVAANKPLLNWDRLPKLKRWFDAVRDRPAVLNGMRVFV